MSQHLKTIPGEPLGGFLMGEFMDFAKRWPDKKDFEKWSMTFSKSGYPIVGRSDLLAIIFRAAIIPETLKDEEADLLGRCYRRAPDMTLALLGRLRECWKKASPHRKAILLSEGLEGPKEILKSLSKTEAAAQGTVKAERRKLRYVTQQIAELKKSAHSERDAELARKHPETFKIQIVTARKSSKVTKRR